VNALVIAASGVLGLAVGSFLNVVVWRVPRGESVLRPRSRCTGCGTQLADRDNVPVLSWLLLHGRCRTCAAPISARYPLLELACGALFAATAARFGAGAALPAYLVLAAGLIALTAIEVELGLLPDSLLYPTAGVVAVLLVGAAVAEAEPRRLACAAGGAAASLALSFGCRLLAPQRVTAGDVRLALVLGAAVGWLGLILVPLFLVLSLVTWAVTGVACAASTRRRHTATTAVGAFLALGAEAVILLGRRFADL